MSPWLALTLLTAGLNLSAFLAIRGRWGRIVVPLAGGALGGTLLGDALGSALGIGALQIGDYHLLAASVTAQIAMVAILLGSVLVPAAGEPFGRAPRRQRGIAPGESRQEAANDPAAPPGGAGSADDAPSGR